MYVRIEGEGSSHFLTLAKDHLCIKIETCFFAETTWPFLPFFYESFKVHGMQIC